MRLSCSRLALARAPDATLETAPPPATRAVTRNDRDTVG